MIALPAHTPHPLAGLTFWHGTPLQNIEGILRNGVNLTTPGEGRNTRVLHACLSIDPACALWFGRINIKETTQRLDGVALFAVPGETLDPTTLCPEFGVIRFPYGHKLARIQAGLRQSVPHTWQSCLEHTSCIGVRAPIKMRPEWIDTRFFDVKAQTMKDSLREFGAGEPHEPEIIERLKHAPSWNYHPIPMAMAA